MSTTAKRRVVETLILIFPVLMLLSIVYSSSLVLTFIQSFQTYIPGRLVYYPYVFTLQNWVDYFGTTLTYYTILWDTLRISLIASLLAIGMGYPVAYKIARAGSPLVRKSLLIIVILTFFLSMIVRVFSWFIIFSRIGPINSIL